MHILNFTSGRGNAMNRPVIIGASVCGLLLVGLVTRPLMWSGGDDNPGNSGSIIPAVATATRAHGTLHPVSQFKAMTQVELQEEAELLWRRAVEIQGSLHRASTSEQREQLLAQLEDVVDRSNRVQTLLED
jgi:hypothetical protein